MYMHTCKHTCKLVCRHLACYMREFLTFPWSSLIMWLVHSERERLFSSLLLRSASRTLRSAKFLALDVQQQCACATTGCWWRGRASLGALSAPLSWVQFDLLWIFAMGAQHLCAEVSVAPGCHRRAGNHLPAAFLRRPLVIDTSLC